MSHAWMPLYVADYLADTGHLSTVEHGAYMLLIMHYWQTGVLPDDDRKLARIVRLTADQWQEIRDTLADLFEPGWTHKRIDAELAHASDVISKRSAAAKEMHAKRKAGARKVQSTCDANAHANAEQVHMQNAIPSPSPSPNNHTADASTPPQRTRQDLDDLEAALRDAAAPVLDAAAPGLLSLSPILSAIGEGCDLEMDVMPAIREVAARPGRGPPRRVRSWEFFVPAIRQAHARRTAILPEVTHDRPHSQPADRGAARPNAFMSRLAEIVARETQHLGSEVSSDPAGVCTDSGPAAGAHGVVVQLALPAFSGSGG